MQAIRWILYFFAALFVVTAIFVVLPWSTFNAFVGWFGPYAYPDEPLIQYSIKAMLALFFWIGVLMFVVVARPEKYPTRGMFNSRSETNGSNSLLMTPS